ncbi:MAG: ribbon-helix-helix protein, CopG family [Gammaproteobacteria bacterium]|nr:ribbon-helix-helix protein, CopG family [Caldilineaceae bacterium]MCB1925838.1 ribbon-helix-helix protein, CopG family [Gammaproteobacteria bacterium]
MNELAEATGADSQSEVVRRALRVYDYLISEREKGHTLVMKSDDGEQLIPLI